MKKELPIDVYPYSARNQVVVFLGLKRGLPAEATPPMYVTDSDLFQFCLVLIGLAGLFIAAASNIKKK